MKNSKAMLALDTLLISLSAISAAVCAYILTFAITAELHPIIRVIMIAALSLPYCSLSDCYKGGAQMVRVGIFLFSAPSAALGCYVAVASLI